MRGQNAILERFVRFSHEVSIICARSPLESISCFDLGENLHKGGILYSTTVPARLCKPQLNDAILIIARMIVQLST